ncbi:MAG: DMT family transporter [Sandaracinaceae bacterium]
MRTPSGLTRGVRLMLAAAFLFSVMSVLVKLAGARLPTMEIVLARGVVTLVLSALALWRSKTAPFGTHHGLLVLRGLFGFGGLACYFYAVTHLPLADATVIHFINPVLTAILAFVILKERFPRVAIVGAGLALIGVVLVARPTALTGEVSLDPLSVGVALAGAGFAAGAYVTVRSLAGKEEPMVIVFYFPLVAVPLTLPLVWSVWVWPTPTEWLLLLGVGVATQLAQVAMTRGLHLESAGRATTVSQMQVAFAFGWGLLLFHETPSLFGVLGALAIVMGILLVARSKATADPPRAAS